MNEVAKKAWSSFVAGLKASWMTQKQFFCMNTENKAYMLVSWALGIVFWAAAISALARWNATTCLTIAVAAFVAACVMGMTWGIRLTRKAVNQGLGNL